MQGGAGGKGDEDDVVVDDGALSGLGRNHLATSVIVVVPAIGRNPLWRHARVVEDAFTHDAAAAEHCVGLE